MNFAESSMFIAIATSLALTSISNPQGSQNCDVDETWPYTSGTIRYGKYHVFLQYTNYGITPQSSEAIYMQDILQIPNSCRSVGDILMFQRYELVLYHCTDI